MVYFQWMARLPNSMRFVISLMNLVPWFIMMIVMPQALWANTVKVCMSIAMSWIVWISLPAPLGKPLEEHPADSRQAGQKLLICSDSDLDHTYFPIPLHLIYALPH